MPQITKDLGFDFWWDTQKLWAFYAPVIDVEIEKLEWLFELPFWDNNGKQTTLKPIDVKMHPEIFKEQYIRTMNTDLNYPINIIYLKNRWVVMDGLHRLLKCSILGDKTIKAKVFQPEDIPFIELK